MFHVVFCILLLVIYMSAVADQLPRLGKREQICLLPFTCSYVVSRQRGFLFRLELVMGCVILLRHSMGLPYNFFCFCFLRSTVSPEKPGAMNNFKKNLTISAPICFLLGYGKDMLPACTELTDQNLPISFKVLPPAKQL